MGKFEEVYAINVNDKTEKKGNLTYLSWAFAWVEFKKIYPKATYTVDKFDGSYCTGNDKLGYMVRTEVMADDLVYEMWLPVMDMRNNAILQPKMTEVNKTIMRCLTKNLAMFGLGLYIYAGEDLPEGDDGDDGEEKGKVKPIQKPKNTPKTDDKPKGFEPITRDEILRKWGVKQVEETIVWFEGKFGCEFEKWNEEQTEVARLTLKAKKDKREAEAKREAAMHRIDGRDIPFPMGD